MKLSGECQKSNRDLIGTPGSLSFLLCGIVFLFFPDIGVADSGIPERIGNWRVEVEAAGNTFHETPAKNGKSSDFAPPSAAVLRWVEIIAPGAVIKDLRMRNDNYRIKVEYDVRDTRHRYELEVRADGKLRKLKKLESRSDGRRVEEKSGNLIFRQTRENVPVEDLPAAALEALTKALPDTEPLEAWRAQTIAGERYIILMDDLVFYVRPDGHIQAAGLLKDGALNEIDPPKMYNLTGDETYAEELRILLEPYRDRFKVRNRIEELGKKPRSADGSYRYIVMGDGRSQYDLWSSILAHIDALEPKPDFMITTGDLVLRGTAREFREYFIPPLLETDIPCFPAIGNHDTGWGGNAREFRFLFGDDAMNYHFDYGKARYIFFDNVSGAQTFEQTLAWLDRTLADTPAGFRKVLSAHKPPATIGKWAYHAMNMENSQSFTHLMTKHRVDEVFLGHIHAYSTASLGGVAYTVSGGGGAGLHNRYGPKGDVHHYILCDVMADGTVEQRVVRFFRENRKVDATAKTNGE